MNLLELIDKREQKLQVLSDMKELVKNEKRTLTDEEQVNFDLIKVEIEDLNKQIDDINEADKRANLEVNNKKNNRSKMEKYDLFSKILEARNGEVIKLDVEQRDITAGGAGKGQEMVAEDKLGLIEPLRDKLVLVQAGATLLTGLKGDVSIPIYNGTNALWKGETAAAESGDTATSEITLTPKRLTAYIDVSKQFLLQDSVNAEAMLMKDIVAAISNKLESTVFSVDASGTTSPGGLLNGTLVFNTGATWTNIVGLETSVRSANIDFNTSAYITNASGAGALKSTLKASNTAVYLMEDGSMNGYLVYVTNSVTNLASGTTAATGSTSAGLVFGDWSQLLIGQWGTIDLTVDTITQAVNGNVRLVVNAYFDVKPRFSGAFKAAGIIK